MLAQSGAYAFSDFDGFPPQKLPDYGFIYLWKIIYVKSY
jgi:hypothetical protein